jgi:hypothetical protein
MGALRTRSQPATRLRAGSRARSYRSWGGGVSGAPAAATAAAYEQLHDERDEKGGGEEGDSDEEGARKM